MAGLVFTHRISRSWSDANGRSLTATTSITADSEDNRTIAVPINAATVVEVAIRSAGLKILYLLCDVACTITAKALDGSTSRGSFVLVANLPYVWTSLDGVSNPLSGDVATLSINSAAVGTLSVSLLQDSTP